MKALITGITGFVGSHLVDYILANHPDVAIYGLVRWRSPMDNLKHISANKLNMRYGDLADLSSLIGILKEINPVFIFHLAAQPLVEVAYHNPKQTLYTNIIGTINILESSRLYQKIKAVVIASSDKAYGKLGKKKYIETDKVGYIKTIPGTSKTNIAGVFAAGDVQDPHDQGQPQRHNGVSTAEHDAIEYLLQEKFHLLAYPLLSVVLAHSVQNN